MFIGNLPESLESLNINFLACEKFEFYATFADFWNELIAPLKHLLSFKAVNKHTQTIDSGSLDFPPRLQVFGISSSSFDTISLVDGLPDSILLFSAHRADRYRSDDDTKSKPVPFLVRDELQFDELKKRVELETTVLKWILQGNE
ncbi:unnamed protein product [Ambrosiozyma monospora]|uniref:Unnamed protein product n=1 Tax=Ambrosiozyma monospora TaxID=43982 RepID=A0ACB5U3C7_AMBMO|nr:unnamed protein product [Ambrosiozyma monospora]